MPKTKSLLINFPGIPSLLSALMPDNGMATLAGALITNNHYTQIFDYSTIDTIEKFSKNPFHEDLKKIFTVITTKLYMSQNPTLEEYNQLNKIEQKINTFKKSIYTEIAKEICEYIKNNKIDFIGIKLWMGEGFEGSIEIASQIKNQNPEIPIFAGGPQVDAFKELIYEETKIFDALAYGEGDETIVKLAEFVQGNLYITEIPNLIYYYKKTIKYTFPKRIQDMELMPLPNYNQKYYKALRKDNKILFFFLDESRGCPNACNFCPHPNKSGRQWRSKSGERIVSEMDYINKLYKTKTFRLSGSNTPLYTLKSLANTLIKKNKDYRYSGFGHIKKGNLEDFKLLKKSNCTSLAFGIESGSDYILNESMNKFIDRKDIEKTITNCKKAGINTIASIIFPAPLETEETKKETMDLLLKLKPSSVLVSLPGVFPNTQWFSSPQKFNIGINLKNKREIAFKIMKYKPKLTHPPILWNPLPYKVNNKDSFELGKESNELIFELQKHDITTQLMDEVFVMSECLNINPQKFSALSREYISTGQCQKLRQLVKDLNNSL